MTVKFDRYAQTYDSGFMGKGSGRFYADLIRELEVRDGTPCLTWAVVREASSSSSVGSGKYGASASMPART